MICVALVAFGFAFPVAAASEQDAKRYREYAASRTGAHIANLLFSETLRDLQEATGDMQQQVGRLQAVNDSLYATGSELASERDRIAEMRQKLIDEASQGDDRRLGAMIVGLAVSYFGSQIDEIPQALTVAVSAGARTYIETESFEHTMLAMTIAGSLTYGTEKAFDKLSGTGWDPADLKITADFFRRLETEVDDLVRSFMEPRPLLPRAALPQDLDVRAISQTAMATYGAYLVDRGVRPLVSHTRADYTAASDREKRTKNRIAAQQFASELWSRPDLSAAFDEAHYADRQFMEEGVQEDRLSADVAGAADALLAEVDEYNRVRAALSRREGVLASLGKSIFKLAAAVVGNMAGGPLLGAGLATGVGTLMEGGGWQAATFDAAWSAGTTFVWEELRGEDPEHAGLTDHLSPIDFPDCERVSHPLCVTAAVGGHGTSPPVDMAPTGVAVDAPTVDLPSTLPDDPVLANDIRHFGRWDHLPSEEREQAWVTLYVSPKEVSLKDLESPTMGHVAMRIEFYDRLGQKQDLTVGFWPTERRSLFTRDGYIKVERPPPGLVHSRIHVDREKVLDHWPTLSENAGKVVDQWYLFPVSNCVTFVRDFLAKVGVEVGRAVLKRPSDFVDDLPGIQCSVRSN